MDGNTWGISGPAFLGVYGALLGLAALFGGYQWFASRVAADVLAWPGRHKTQAPDSGSYDSYTLAYLADGPARVAAVAVAGLVTVGAVRVDRNGRLSAAEGGYPADAFESAALERIRRGRHRLSDVTSAFADLPAIKEIENRLLADGLLVKPACRARRIRVAVVFGLVLLIGAIRAVAGTRNDHPVGYLGAELAVGAIAGLALIALLDGDPVVARRGKAVTKQARARCAGAVGPAAVAALGLAALGDAKVAKFLLKGSSSSNSNAGSDGGSGGGCGG